MDLSAQRATGAAGEAACDLWMQRLGFVFVARNVRLFGTEFDRLYRRGQELWFVEVKSVAESPRLTPEAGLGRARQRSLLWIRSAQCLRQQQAIGAWQLGATPEGTASGHGPWSPGPRCSAVHALVVVVLGVAKPCAPGDAGRSSPRAVHWLEAFELPSGRLLSRGRLPVT